MYTMQKIFFILIAATLLMISCQTNKIKIACVGDSITEGYGLACQSKTAYPVILDSILGPSVDVLNSGRSATTLQKKADFPYWTAKEFSNVFTYKPDVILIKLGTNDTKPYNWKAENYENDYQALIDTFRTIPTNPKIYLILPVPVFKTRWGINDSTVVNGVIPIIEKLAKTNNLPVIDLYHATKDQALNFFDSIHPNEAANKKMAEFIAKEINNL